MVAYADGTLIAEELPPYAPSPPRSACRKRASMNCWRWSRITCWRSSPACPTPASVATVARELG
jgi:hypothetical protein